MVRRRFSLESDKKTKCSISYYLFNYSKKAPIKLELFYFSAPTLIHHITFLIRYFNNFCNYRNVLRQSVKYLYNEPDMVSRKY